MFKLKKLFIFLILCSPTFISYAQISVKAEVDRTVMEVGEEAMLVITIKGASSDIGVPSLPPMPNFNAYYAGYSTFVDEYNGRVSSVYDYMFRLAPRFAGKAEIDPVIINYLGKRYSTDPIVIDVYRKGESEGKAPPSQKTSKNTAKPAAPAPTALPGNTVQERPQVASPKKDEPLPPRPKGGYKDIFLITQTDKKEAYMGEQITLTVGFYNSVNLYGDIFYDPPTYEGLLKEDLAVLNNKRTMDGKTYNYNILKYGLFGAAPGKAKISAATVNYIKEVKKNIDPFAVFYTTVTEKGAAKSEPLEITIKPLPEEGKGQYFYGAVGTAFYVNAEVDRKELEVGEAATLTLTVKGTGNLKALATPKMEKIKGFKSYEVAGATQSTPVNDVIQGTKTFRYVFIPSVSGTHTIPQINFTYFNPKTAEYKTIQTQPITLDVKPMSAGGGAEVISFGGQDGMGGSAKLLSSEINYIKENAGAAQPFDILRYMAANPWINLIPVILILLLLGRNAADKYGVFDKPYGRAKKAASKAKNIDELENVISVYIKEKTSLSTGTLTTKALAQLLTEKYKIGPKLKQQFIIVEDSLNMLRYSPVGSVTPQVFNKAKANVLYVLKALEKELK
ncbi:hypothetical protein Dip510_001363 [Elusimicrobium posterum]|uniref:BatD family protein n=1 Tax=Elusimicrobium posterum TaxID=3116653 RepID=UPI003C729B98